MKEKNIIRLAWAGSGISLVLVLLFHYLGLPNLKRIFLLLAGFLYLIVWLWKISKPYIKLEKGKEEAQLKLKGGED